MRVTWLLPLALLGCPEQAPETPAPPAADADGEAKAKAEAQAFIDEYVQKSLPLAVAWTEAEWQANIKIVDGDESLTKAAADAHDAYAKYAGSAEVIEAARKHLAHKDLLDPIQVRQLDVILYTAADAPQTIPDVVRKRIDAEGKQSQKLYGYAFKVADQEVTPNDIDGKLRESADVAERLAYWEASKAVGPTLKDGMVELRGLRNETVRALGYHDYYSYQVSQYGMNPDEMSEMLDRLQRELRPLYRELHTWARYELARKYNQPVPEQLPAHWLPNRWGQDWSSLVTVEGVDVDAALKDKQPEEIVKMGEAFYVSLGFPALPPTFWEKSSLYPVPADAGFKKNTHASAWHMDYDQDVRSLMSVEPNSEWYETSNHELGHIYYYVSYTRPETPILLREGANRAFHEAIGSQMGIAAMQRPFLENRGLIAKGDPAKAEEQKIQLLLRDALSSVAFIPFAACTMTRFERDLYVKELPADQWNKAWWDYVGQCQGIVAPSPRGEEFADALTKTHINDDPAQYYDYALSYFLLYQVHDHIAKNILHQDPTATDYYGNQEVGAYLKGILEVGGTRDWRELTREKTGKDLSAEPMVQYYAPLLEWLKKQNEGRTHTLPEI